MQDDTNSPELPRPVFLAAIEAIDTAASCLTTTAEYDWLISWCQRHGVSSTELLRTRGISRLRETKWRDCCPVNIAGVESLQYFVAMVSKGRLDHLQLAVNDT